MSAHISTMTAKCSLFFLLLFISCIANLKAQTISGNFESPVFTNPPLYKIDPTVAGWTFSTGNAGVARDGSKYDSNGVWSPAGNQYVFLDPTLGGGVASISYNVSLSTTDTQLYTVYFVAIQAVTNTQQQSITVSVSGATQLNLGSYTPYLMSGAVAWGSYQTSAFYLNPGTNTITLSSASGGQAVLVDNVILAKSTTQSNGLIVSGLLDVSGNIDFGTYQGYTGLVGNGPGALLSYTDNNGSNASIGLSAAGVSASFLWQDTAFNSINYFTNTPQFKNKMLLDGSNNLTIYGTNGSAGIVLNPNTGGIQLAGGSSGITLADGTVLNGAASMHSAALYNGSSVALSVNTNGALVPTSGSFAVTANTIAIGGTETASGALSTALGQTNTASGPSSTAIGLGNVANNWYSTAFGEFNTSSCGFSTAIGGGNTASGQASLAVGLNNTASGGNAVAIGQACTASGGCSLAMGVYSTSSGSFSTTLGYLTKAASYGSMALGQNNVGVVSTGGNTNWVSTDPLLEIGNGNVNAWANPGTPSDAVIIFKNGEQRNAGLIQSQAGVRVPPTGDLSMGSYTNGNNPATLNPATGLLYPSGN